jgi:1,4-dihydroxy-2-naphthoyl-CoA synthase
VGEFEMVVEVLSAQHDAVEALVFVEGAEDVEIEPVAVHGGDGGEVVCRSGDAHVRVHWSAFRCFCVGEATRLGTVSLDRITLLIGLATCGLLSGAVVGGGRSVVVCYSEAGGWVFLCMVHGV